MIANFQIADWIICGIALVAAVTGLFRGFSGTLAFLLASAGAALTGKFGWVLSGDFSDIVWQRVAGTIVATLLIFGIVRIIVRKVVNGLLAQPADAIFGFVAGIGFGVLLVVVWAWLGNGVEYSTIVTAVAEYLK